MSHKILNGDCLEILKTLDNNSIDSLITDPPAGISFMGKSWDDDKGGRKQWIAWLSEVMIECKRVMKPGAHGLVWSLPRTSHWTATACEDAGFEIRDCVSHLFGSGFPKSLNISKAIDRADGAKREVIGPKKDSDGRIRAIEPMSDKIKIANGRTLQNSITKPSGNFETIPSTNDAKQWDGWGTALKPAVEFWWLVRKPLSEKTVAENVLKWGTGGINIDGCRIEAKDQAILEKNWDRVQSQAQSKIATALSPKEQIRLNNYTPQGRFPANLVLSHSPHCTDTQCDIECAIEILDRQSDRASRFFYCAKTCTSERNAGLEGMPDKKYAQSGGAQSAIAHGKTEYHSETQSGFDTIKIVKNHHPTVKPQKLMRYFCRLITPPNGTVLDPFMGSGSTGLAAKSEGFNFIGIEKEREYFEIAEKRIVHG